VGSATHADLRCTLSVNVIDLLQEASREEGRIHIHLQKLEQRMNEKLEVMDCKLNTRLEAMERRLEKIADAVGVKKMVAEGNDDEDRKRLKERLNEALGEHRRKVLRSEGEREGWIEYFFGICKPNGRLGKHGSRFVKAHIFSCCSMQ
jgi:hypothetical protein